MQNTTPNRQSIQPLEDALNFWEDRLCIFDATMRFHKKQGRKGSYTDPGVKNWSQFRKYVLERKPLEDNFRIDQLIQSGLCSLPIHFLPQLIWLWNFHSRKVFHVSSDLDLELRTTRMADIMWKEVLPPFEAFIVTLDEPIVFKDIEFHTIMCNFFSEGNGVEKPGFTIGLIPSLPDGYRAMTPGFRQQILRAAERGNEGMIEKTLNERNTYWFNTLWAGANNIAVFSGMWDAVSNRKVGDSFSALFEGATMDNSYFEDGTDDEGTQVFDLAVRIVVGMILHLQSLTPDERARSASKWQPVRTNAVDTSAIFSEAEICTVSSLTELTDEDRAEFRTILRESKGGYELSAHMRCGYWRRKPGSGNDPGAPKCVRVRPARVRFDRIAGVAALPKGSETSV